MSEQNEKAEHKNQTDEINEAQSAAAEHDDEEFDDEEEESSGGRKAQGGGGGQRRTKLSIAIVIGVVVAGWLIIRQMNNPESGPPLPAAGSTVTGDLTLVAADRNELECAAEKGLQSYLCGFSDEKQARQVDEANKLRPFMTVDRQLFLIPGLFLEPSVSQRFNMEGPKPRGEQKRFTAKCKIKIVGALDGVKLRWSPTGTWEAAKKFPVATVSDCAIEG